ncbi:hypothetical protein HG536_0E04180 [Torulaspora globosa]|uniref:U3 small nucleolar ribonucleoprotein protein MPP10 n=1 Tax=Torulaspora globosa TaxID=48254 RepID=A0A7G3ZJ21_9SACH|nr:uncharacterized protein HG536_0E04180 [Torulaspora globosa]QLL33507.1 hypothetical protein HG536_0E04180 [Torulaspora globosa]
MSRNFIEAIQSDPISIFYKEPSFPLKSVKTYLDGVIKLSRQSGFQSSDIDEITIDGMDANQVWWQAKMVLDSVEGNLLAKIQEYQEDATSTGQDSENSDSNSDSDFSSAQENAEVDLEGIEDEAENASESENASYTGDLKVGGLSKTAYLAAKEDSEDESSDMHEESMTYSGVDEPDQDEGADDEENGLNDDFFNLEEFNKQTTGIEDGTGIDTDDESVDWFNEIPSDEEEEAVYYEDFFDKPGFQNQKANIDRTKNSKQSDEHLAEADYDDAVDSVKLDLFAEEQEASELEDVNPGTSLSTYERQQIDIQKQIEQLEQEAVAEKKWALQGEIEAQDRPADSLLTEDVEFDRTAKPVPVVTTEVTESIEQMIRRRIQEYNFDDLPKRVISDVSSQSAKPQFELSDQKSARSLAQIYEEDYKNIPQDAEISEEIKKSHDEITSLFTNLCYKLDALSSAHFIPKPAEKSLEVRVDTAAISMEDAQPLSMSSASALAPQEIYKVERSRNMNEITLKNGITMSKDELTRDDKNRLRRAAKRKRSKTASQITKKKSKKDEVINTLAKNKNVTVINSKGEKHDVRGRVINLNDSGEGANRIKL